MTTDRRAEAGFSGARAGAGLAWAIFSHQDAGLPLLSWNRDKLSLVTLLT
jgi:hypothetical protein